MTVRVKAKSLIGNLTLVGLTSALVSTAQPASPVVTLDLSACGSLLLVNFTYRYVAADAGCAGAGLGAG